MLINLPNLVYKVKTLRNNPFKRRGNVCKPDQGHRILVGCHKGKSGLQFNGSLKGQHFRGALIFYVNSEYIYSSVCQKDRSVNMIDDSIKR